MMVLATPTVTVWFNETRGSRFTRYHPTDEMVKSRWFSRLRVEVEIPDRLMYNGPDVTRLTAETAMAEQVFILGNADDRPNGQMERSISVGDVIVIHGPGWLSPNTEWAVETAGLRVLGPGEWPPHGPGWPTRPTPPPAAPSPPPPPARRPRGRRTHQLDI
jgi:hypothetical protein